MSWVSILEVVCREMLDEVTEDSHAAHLPGPRKSPHTFSRADLSSPPPRPYSLFECMATAAHPIAESTRTVRCVERRRSNLTEWALMKPTTGSSSKTFSKHIVKRGQLLLREAAQELEQVQPHQKHPGLSLLLPPSLYAIRFLSTFEEYGSQQSPSSGTARTKTAEDVRFFQAIFVTTRPSQTTKSHWQVIKNTFCQDLSHVMDHQSPACPTAACI
ncbi:hypothetical protein CB1_060782048 [Camelus ferus]|nr:hypothetical protein CB1_060782048 [Camelus ferus]